MPAGLENSAVSTGLEKVSFHSNPKERKSQGMFKLLHNCAHHKGKKCVILYSNRWASLVAQRKESTRNAGYPGSIPGLGRSPGEGIGCPLQDSWASLVAQLVKSPPTMRETWVRSLGWEDPMEEGTTGHSSILAWRIPMDRGAWWARVHIKSLS